VYDSDQVFLTVQKYTYIVMASKVTQSRSWNKSVPLFKKSLWRTHLEVRTKCKSKLLFSLSWRRKAFEQPNNYFHPCINCFKKLCSKTKGKTSKIWQAQIKDRQYTKSGGTNCFFQRRNSLSSRGGWHSGSIFTDR
jgi:hypothetical protein